MVIGSGVLALSPAVKKLANYTKYKMQRQELVEKVVKAFKHGEIYRKSGDKKTFPVINTVDFKQDKTVIVFTLPLGVHHLKVKKKLYVFQQAFGKNIGFDVDVKKCVLTVYKQEIPKEVKYNYSQFYEVIKHMKMPVIAGINLNGQIRAYDMVNDSRANLIIIGEPGAGKSTQL